MGGTGAPKVTGQRRQVPPTNRRIHMTRAARRDPLTDHLLTPENGAMVVIDYQPSVTTLTPARRAFRSGCEAGLNDIRS
jgi:hypothetical protein